MGWAEVIRQTVPFLLVCVPRLLGGWGGHDHASNVAPAEKYLWLYFHLHYSEMFLARFLISFVFNKAATIVLNRISSLHKVWFSHIKGLFTWSWRLEVGDPGRWGNPPAEFFFGITFWRSLDTRLNQGNQAFWWFVTILFNSIVIRLDGDREGNIFVTCTRKNKWEVIY